MYISREQILTEVDAIYLGLKAGNSEAWAMKRLKKLRKRGKEKYGEASKAPKQDKLRGLISKNPGIGYKDLAKKSGFSRNFVRTLVRTMDDVDEVVNEDGKAYYGNKPIGLWIIDEYEPGRL